MNVLVVDVGGTHVKLPATRQKQFCESPSRPMLTTKQMVGNVKKRRIGCARPNGVKET
jgi:polyphosphate glucokinase